MSSNFEELKSCAVRVGTLSAVTLLCACANTNVTEKQAAVADRISQVEATLVKKEDSANRKLVEFSDTVYLGRKFAPVVRDSELPAVFKKELRKPVTFQMGGERINLTQLSELFTQQTGIPVEINQNVFLRSSSLPTSSTAASTTGGGNPAPLQRNDQVANMAYEFERNVIADFFKGDAEIFLDLVTTRLGISWEYTPSKGKVEFFRFKTRTFQVKNRPGSRKEKSSFASNGSVGGTQNGAAGSIVNTTSDLETTIDYWDALSKELRLMTSAGGDFAINPPAGTVTVSDTPTNLRRIEDYVREQNRRVGRQVIILVDLITVTTNDINEAGVDVAGLITDANGKLRYFTSPGDSVLSSQAGGLTAIALAADLGASGKLPSLSNPGYLGDPIQHAQGTQAAIRALSKVGQVTKTGSYRVSAMTGDSTPVTKAETISYIDNVGVSQGNNSSVSTVQQKTLTTGVSLTLLPRIYDDNSLVLSYTLSRDDTATLEKKQTASGIIESPRVPRYATQQTIRLIPGETVVASSLRDEKAEGVQAANITGVSRTANTQSETLLVLITPILVADTH